MHNPRSSVIELNVEEAHRACFYRTVHLCELSVAPVG